MTTAIFERSQILLGDDGIARLQAAHVLLAGLGGVGSYAAEALARAGVGRLTLIDHDAIAPSNLNRQLPALHSTLGRPKRDVMAERIADIHPACQVIRVGVFLDPGNVSDYLTGPLDFVLDAIDSLSAKAALVASAHAAGIPVISSQGAGGRLDPTRLRVTDLMDTQVCPLARALRSYLRRRGVGRGILAVWSDEPPHPPLPPQPMARGRARAVNGSVSYLPALFGLTLAGEAIRRIAGGKSRMEME
ncbi:MAG: tRNA threonylcarbamoyladenosine dehydratase [Pseudomonadota bacterium]